PFPVDAGGRRVFQFTRPQALQRPVSRSRFLSIDERILLLGASRAEAPEDDRVAGDRMAASGASRTPSRRYERNGEAFGRGPLADSSRMALPVPLEKPLQRPEVLAVVHRPHLSGRHQASARRSTDL